MWSVEVVGAPSGGSAWIGEDPGELLSTILDAVRAGTGNAIHVLEPVRGADGSVEDFTVVVDTGLLTHLARTPAVGRRLRDLFPPEFAGELVDQYRGALDAGAVSRRDVVIAAGSDGMPVPAMGAGEDGVHIGVVTRVPVGGRLVALGHDVTETRRASSLLAASEARYRRLLDRSTDIVLVLDDAAIVTYASPAVRTIVGTEPEAVIGRRFGSYAHPDDAHLTWGAVQEVLAAGEGASRTVRARLVDAGGELRWVAMTATNWLADPNVHGLVLNLRDVTAEHVATEQLQEQALQDHLTGLPNRRRFMEAIAHAAATSGRTGSEFALLLLDVDDFKDVNDSLGHPAGDALLVALTERVRTALRGSDTLARVGGDEFAVIAPDLHGPQAAQELAHRICETSNSPYLLAGHERRATISVGVATSAQATSPDGPGAHLHVDLELLFRQADEALYAAKRSGGARTHVFHPTCSCP